MSVDSKNRYLGKASLWQWVGSIWPISNPYNPTSFRFVHIHKRFASCIGWVFSKESMLERLSLSTEDPLFDVASHSWIETRFGSSLSHCVLRFLCHACCLGTVSLHLFRFRSSGTGPSLIHVFHRVHLGGLGRPYKDAPLGSPDGTTGPGSPLVVKRTPCTRHAPEKDRQIQPWCASETVRSSGRENQETCTSFLKEPGVLLEPKERAQIVEPSVREQ